jgi:bacterioferritin-associated ferredoxin
MIVCVCKGLSQREIRLCVLRGASTVEEVKEACGAATDCGTCHQAVEQIVTDPAPITAIAPSPARPKPCEVLSPYLRVVLSAG